VAGSPADCLFAMSPAALLTIQDYEDRALQVLDKRAADYYRSGSDQQCTLSRNRSAFDQFLIRPRFLLRDVSKRDLSTTFLNDRITMPIAVAPTAMQKMGHPDGELATAKGAH
jgi:(S)-2-hydroxy-acid oxidase